MGSLVFEPGLVPTAAAAALVLLTLWLGNWQLGRAEEKRARQALLETRMNDTPTTLAAPAASADALLYRRVRAAGRWIPERQFHVDNRILDGRAGFHVITPLAIEGAGAPVVLVNRGWIARNADYPRAPRVPVPEGRVVVAGLATRPPARVLEFSVDTGAGNVWQNLSIERYGKASGLALLPVVVLLDPPAPGLFVVREMPAAGVERHVEYAFTWFALAATALALWLALNLRKAA